MCLPAQEVQRRAFDPWVGKIPWRRTWQPTSVFLPGESMGRGAWRVTVCGVTKSWTRLSTCACARAHTHTHTHTKRLQTQTTRLPTPQTGCPLPRFCSLCVQSSVFYKCSITSSAYRDSFASFLPQVESFFFSCLIAMTRTSSGVLNTNGESGRPYLVPEL